jgi:pantoate--beta-alanine ligase
MQVIRSSREMQAWAIRARTEGVSVGLVPTMGFLHEGHLSLMRLAGERTDRVVVSLFVNPTQFGPNEDLDAYPRDFDRDVERCRAVGVDVLFAPPNAEMYAPDHSVYVNEDALSRGLCGRSRPGHFRGVLTVVAKLFNLVLPDVAVFGEKDAQQIRVIRRMTRDLNFPVEIVGGPIVREPDGVAMSSRNANLSPGAREQAVALSRALADVAGAVARGETSESILRDRVAEVLKSAPLGGLDYLDFVDDETLRPMEGTLQGRVLVAIAVRFPGARLIDNRVVEVPE